MDDAGKGPRGGATRRALERAAVASIVEDGWQAAGTRTVTARAGVPLGALNYHFGSKEELFRSTAMVEIERMFASPWTVIRTSTTTAELVDGMVGWCRSPDVTAQQQALLLEVMSQSRRDPVLSAALDTALTAYRTELAAALHRLGAVPGDGPSRGPRALEVASAFAAQCNGLWLQFVIEPAFPIAAATAAAARAWRAALDRRPARHPAGPPPMA